MLRLSWRENQVFSRQRRQKLVFLPEGSGALTTAPRSIASAVGVSPACICKWLRRHKAQGMVGLHDRSSRPHRWRAQTLEAGEARIGAHRQAQRPFPSVYA
ncbi:MAG: hypothetical protein CR217_02540 [Beijerinckiaceae bacterium]|nr:MAG: hypothetical protein CR217_02540 [Beijerinckiaceae bacterium]